MVKVYLRNGKDKALRMGHPWVFSGAVHHVEGQANPGAICDVFTAGGELLGSGFINTASTIRVRMLSANGETFNASELAQRISDSVALRIPLLNEHTNCCRLVNSEGDRLPGLIVDKYGPGLCVQILTAGMDNLTADIVACLGQCTSPAFIYERSDTDARLREGLTGRDGCLMGTLPHSNVTVLENGRRFNADIATGQKTGFFLDQRENRALFAEYATGKTICDCFCYSGGFSVYGLSSGAEHAMLVDISKDAAVVARSNCALNNINESRYETVSADVFDYLRKTDKQFECIVLDPPKFAKHKGEISAAARGYKDINLLAMKNIKKNGILFTFSCSNAIDPTLFRQIVFAAAADSRRYVQVLHVLCAAPDHAFNIAHREGEYLKGLVLRVI